MLSPDLEETLRRALSIAGERSHEFATLEHLLLALIDDEDAIGVLKGCKVDISELRDLLVCLLYTSPSPRDQRGSRMPSSA